VKCKNCGAELREDAKVCESCGEKVVQTDEDNPKKRSGAIVVLLSVLIGIMLLFGVSVGTFMFVDSQSNTIKESYVKRDEAASRTMAPAAKTLEPMLEQQSAPVATPPPVISSKTHLASPSYSVYQDAEFGFSCAYPTHFEKYLDNTPEGRYTLRNSDGTATLRICAEDNTANITLAQSLSMFTAKNPGQVELQRTGGTYYMVKVNDSGLCRYRYLVSKNSKLCWFDLTYPKDQEGIYESYSQHLYESFTVK